MCGCIGQLTLSAMAISCSSSGLQTLTVVLSCISMCMNLQQHSQLRASYSQNLLLPGHAQLLWNMILLMCCS